MGLVERVVKPVVSGIKHALMKPVTIKYPFIKVENIPEENFRYDPKAGVAYPGYKGRHILYLDKCTGCAACERACQEIAEAIVMLYSFDIFLEFDSGFKSGLEEGGDEARLVSRLLHPLGGVVGGLEEAEGGFRLRLNDTPIWEMAAQVVYENLFMDVFKELEAEGWEITMPEEKPRGEVRSYIIKKNGVEAKLVIKQRDLGYKQNKRSVFPAIDYGRCVFCGFCVDACPFYALEMGGDYELAALEREELFYDPEMLAKPKFNTHPPESTWAEKAVLVLRRYK